MYAIRSKQVLECLLPELDGTLTGVFHSFSGTPEQANRLSALGLKLVSMALSRSKIQDWIKSFRKFLLNICFLKQILLT